MSGTTKYAVIETALCIGGNLHEGEVFMVRANEHDRELSALRGELARKDVVIEDMVESNCDMGQFLAAAEQRNAVMTELLIACRLEFSTSEANAWEIAMREKIDAALKPTESGASE